MSLSGNTASYTTQILKDCDRKHSQGDDTYDSLADAINQRLRDSVGEKHWENACRIQKQIFINRQKNKLQSMQQLKSCQEQKPSAKEEAVKASEVEAAKAVEAAKVVEAAEAMAALSSRASWTSRRSSSSGEDQESSGDQGMEEEGTTSDRGESSDTSGSSNVCAAPRQELGKRKEISPTLPQTEPGAEPAHHMLHHKKRMVHKFASRPSESDSARSISSGDCGRVSDETGSNSGSMSNGESKSDESSHISPIQVSLR